LFHNYFFQSISTTFFKFYLVKVILIAEQAADDTSSLLP